MDNLESHLAGQRTDRLTFWHEVRSAVALESLGHGRNQVVADVGAGAGHLGTVVRRDHPGVAYQFVEPIDSLAHSLEERFGSGTRLESIADISSADLVTLLDVIEHVEDDRGLLGEVVEAMKPGARLVVTVPALPMLWSEWDVRLGHHRRYTRPSLNAASSDLDLTGRRVEYLFPELVAPGLLRRLAGGRVDRSNDGPVTEYPELPSWIDRPLRGVSTVSSRLRRFWPIGTSLLLTGQRR